MPKRKTRQQANPYNKGVGWDESVADVLLPPLVVAAGPANIPLLLLLLRPAPPPLILAEATTAAR